MEQSHHLKTPGSPSGGSSDPLLEHPPSSKQKSASPESGDRGRQRDKQRQERHINTDELWQTKGAHQRGVCPDLAAGNELECLPLQKPDGNHHNDQSHGNGEEDRSAHRLGHGLGLPRGEEKAQAPHLQEEAPLEAVF